MLDLEQVPQEDKQDEEPKNHEQPKKSIRDYEVTNYGFSQEENDRIKSAISLYYMHKDFDNKCKNYQFSIDFDKNQRHVVLNIEKVFADRAEFESFVLFMQNKIIREKIQKSKFPPQKQSYKEWIYDADKSKKDE